MKWLKEWLSQLEIALPTMVLKQLWSFKWILMLGGLVFANAIAVAHFKHQVRNQTALLEQLKHEQYQLEMEWEALRLEQGTLAEHNRIENIAKRKLQMKSIAAKDEVLIDNP